MFFKILLKYVKKILNLHAPTTRFYGAIVCYLWTKSFKYLKTTKLLFLSLLRKSKREYYHILDIKNITDNKTFLKTVKPFLLDKVTSTQKVTLIDNDKIVKSDDNTTRDLNTFFSNIVSDLKILDYNNFNPSVENIQESALKEMKKYI